MTDKIQSSFYLRALLLEQHDWNVSKTAEALDMERSHLYTKIKKYGLETEEAKHSGRGQRSSTVALSKKTLHRV